MERKPRKKSNKLRKEIRISRKVQIYKTREMKGKKKEGEWNG